MTQKFVKDSIDKDDIKNHRKNKWSEHELKSRIKFTEKS
jgi:hypothetical protein